MIKMLNCCPYNNWIQLMTKINLNKVHVNHFLK